MDGWTALTLAAPVYNGNNYTIFAYLLPYVDQQNLFNLLTKGGSPPGTYCGGQYMTPVVVYLCPADASTVAGLSQTTTGGANGFAVGNYVANYLVFGNPNDTTQTTSTESGGSSLDGGLVQGFTKLPAGIPDGMSNTIFFGEAYGSCGLASSPGAANATASLWADSTQPWRPIMCTNSATKNASAGYAACNMFQVQPTMYGTCDPSRAQSPHAGGMNVALGDGSVRFVTPSMGAAWAAACDPRDGVPFSWDQ